MAYVGTPIDTQNQFQSLQGKRFSGNGSTTAFTLDVAPSSVFDIEVFVENVRQDPNSAYNISGTTLTFTGAPPSGTNNIYVIHQAKAVGTIDPPATETVAKTFSSTVSFTGAVTSSSTFQLGGTADMNGTELILDADADTSITADTDDRVDLKIANIDVAQISTANSGDLVIKTAVSDKDFVVKGNDGGSEITALTLDMSGAGAATFNNDVTAFSDKRLKTDIKNIENSLDKVMKMQGVYYKRNDIENAKEQIGVLAQDIENILPQVVLTADDKMKTKSVDYGKLCAVLIEAVKELKQEVNELKKDN